MYMKSGCLQDKDPPLIGHELKPLAGVNPRAVSIHRGGGGGGDVVLFNEWTIPPPPPPDEYKFLQIYACGWSIKEHTCNYFHWTINMLPHFISKLLRRGGRCPQRLIWRKQRLWWVITTYDKFLSPQHAWRVPQGRRSRSDNVKCIHCAQSMKTSMAPSTDHPGKRIQYQWG